MPPARSVRQRAVNNENDENSGTIRLTRAKTAALGGPDELSNVPTKKALQSRKTASNTLNAVPTQRKRAALGDVSNLAKIEAVDGKDSKKLYTGKTALVSKASQAAGIQKLSRSSSSRSILGTKDNNTLKKSSAADLKRPASGSGVMGAAQRKRSKGIERSTKEDTPVSENELPKKSAFTIEIEKRVSVETTEVLKVEDYQPELPEVDDVKQAFEDGVPDLDADDLEDPLMVAEYVVEIFEYFRDLETTSMPNPVYMEHQEHLDWQERHVLIDWLVEVHERFNLLPETLYLATNIIDRFLSTKVVQLDKFQLVGITALFIASKYEEVMSPHVSNFAYVARNDYSDTEILSAERYILQALNWDLSYPNPMNFLRRISKADNYDIQTRTLGKYLLEISVVDYRFMEYLPSHIAAASMYMARLILERGEWDATLSHYAGYTEEEILPVFKLMVDYCGKPIKHDAFHKKYARKKYLKASLLVRQWAKKYYPMYIDNMSPEDVDAPRRA